MNLQPNPPILYVAPIFFFLASYCLIDLCLGPFCNGLPQRKCKNVPVIPLAWLIQICLSITESLVKVPGRTLLLVLSCKRLGLLQNLGKLLSVSFVCELWEFRAFWVFLFRSARNLNTKNLINPIAHDSHFKKKSMVCIMLKKLFMTLVKEGKENFVQASFYSGVL